MAKSYRQSQFDNLEKKNVNKSLFNLSHEIKTQMCFGRYYPIHFEECLPGDEWEIDAEYNFQFPGMYFPIQQIGTMRADWFYCPYSLMYRGDNFLEANYQKTGWVGFIMGEDIELPKTELNINGAGWGGNSASEIYAGCAYPIENYLGFPFDTHGRLDEHKQIGVTGSAFPLSMYLFCYDEYYRNPQWEEPVFFQLSSDANENKTNFDNVVQQVGDQIMVQWAPTASGNIINHDPFFAHYEKDYFTSSRPEPQDGDAILIPSMGIDEDGNLIPSKLKNLDGTPAPDQALYVGDAPEGNLIGDLANDPLALETQATIKQLRLYQVLQQFHERIMRIGKRYRGYIEGLWGNDPEPNAVDIPQLIGSHFGRIQISDTKTTADTDDANTGNYRGNLNFYNNGTTHRYYCQDYGLIMCILNVMPNTGYSRGIEPKWTREVNTDFALDMFSGIGDQEIKKKELWAIADNRIWGDTDEPFNDTIAYQDRFAEYKTRTNRIFNTAEIYNSFYMGQIMSGDYLNYPNIGIPGILVGQSNSATGDGIREVDIFNQQPIKSGVSTYVDSTIWAHIYLTLKVKRCLPYFSTPGKMIL